MLAIMFTFITFVNKRRRKSITMINILQIPWTCASILEKENASYMFEGLTDSAHKLGHYKHSIETFKPK